MSGKKNVKNLEGIARMLKFGRDSSIEFFL
jgi:hypothetical protein